ncbi:DNA sulfur modification protein DndB [Myxosarcina sp. GI1]|uniref:DNA sulfur modification protein DndB n=1 Tax=Myxosarcina sp. GI1 TaxID=1541065 RepID=UPI00068BB663|nr:DNA sulfur modification protein DndB [Myxosarcina sp. GI1]
MEETTFAELCSKTVYAKQVENYGKERVSLGIGNNQGQRLVIQIIIYASEIPNLFRNISRPIIESHLLEIKEYILKQASAGKKWIVGALTANVDPELIKCESIGSSLYIISIPNATPLDVTDGQHRIGAIASIIDSEHRELIANEQIPLTLILEKSSRQANVDFTDMAKGTTISNSLLVAFGSEGRDAIALELLRRVNLFRGSTRLDSASPGSGSKYIYTLNYIAGLVGCAMDGNSNASLAEYDDEKEIEQVGIELSEILNEFFSGCPITTNLSQKEKLTPEEVKNFRSTYILGLSIGLEILGCLIYQLRQGNLTITQIATQIDWSRDNNLWNEIFPHKKATTNNESLGTLPLSDAIEQLIN